VEEAVLLPERLVVGVSVRLARLEGHVGVGDFGDRRDEEDEREEEDEDADGHVHPLHVLDGGLVVEGEEHVGAQHGRDHGADSIEGLGDVDTDLGVLWGTTHYKEEEQLSVEFISFHSHSWRFIGALILTGNIRVSSSLERAQAATNNSDGNDEACE